MCVSVVFADSFESQMQMIFLSQRTSLYIAKMLLSPKTFNIGDIAKTQFFIRKFPHCSNNVLSVFSLNPEANQGWHIAFHRHVSSLLQLRTVPFLVLDDFFLRSPA